MNMKKAFKALKKAEQAVSPVVATLMLVLVAAAAAVGISVFMNDFQENTEQNVADGGAERVLQIGGSSTVYEFSLAAIDAFELANPNIDVIVNSGGSGSGRAGVCNGALDIGSASSAIKLSHQETCKELSGGKEMKVFKVATDGVVFVVDSTNDACTGVPELTQTQAWEVYTYNADNFGTFTGTLPTATMDGVGGTYTDVAGDIQWGEIPDSAGGYCDKGTTTSPDTVVEIFDRKDPGGTSEAASEFLFGQDAKQLEDADLTLNDAHQGDGNQGVGDIADGNADALWFSSFGYAAGQGWTLASFGIDNAPIVPTAATVGDGTFEATRPIQYMTLGEPGPLERLWLDFVMNSELNQDFAEEADFESIY